MNDKLARWFFILIPALLIGVVFSILTIPLGVLMFIQTVYLGYFVTKPRPERGEF